MVYVDQDLGQFILVSYVNGVQMKGMGGRGGEEGGRGGGCAVEIFL